MLQAYLQHIWLNMKIGGQPTRIQWFQSIGHHEQWWGGAAERSRALKGRALAQNVHTSVKTRQGHE